MLQKFPLFSYKTNYTSNIFMYTQSATTEQPRLHTYS